VDVVNSARKLPRATVVKADHYYANGTTREARDIHPPHPSRRNRDEKREEGRREKKCAESGSVENGERRLKDAAQNTGSHYACFYSVNPEKIT